MKDVFVISKDQSCETYNMAEFTERELVHGDSTDLF